MYVQRSTTWLGSSVGRIFARQPRGPGFESRSGHDFSSYYLVPDY